MYNKSYFEAGRSPRKRSLQEVNEHFEGKPDDKIALFDSFFLQSNLKDTFLNVTLAKHRSVTILGEEDSELTLAY